VKTWCVGDTKAAVSGAASASTAEARLGTTRIKIAVVLLALPSVVSAAFLVFAVPGLLLNPGGAAFYLNGAAITWPLGVPLVAAASALVLRATWSAWSLRLLILGSLAWLAAGAYVLAGGGTVWLLAIAALVVVLLASVVRDRRRWMERPTRHPEHAHVT
jgi:hypothetical protein